MTILKVRHVTTYSYARPVRFGEHRIMFRPRDSHDQHLLSADISISPAAATHWIHDVFGNCITIAEFTEPSDQLRFESNIVLDHTPEMVPRFRTDERAKHWPFEYDPDALPDIEPYLRPHHPAPEVEAFARKFTRSGLETETGHLLMTMTRGIRECLRYNRRTDPGTQSPIETLTTRTGTCRDYALLMIEACRALGLAARFVSGYIYVPSRDTGTTLRGGGATHAWVQVYIPGAGWVEFDPTNGLVGSKDLIRVAVAREPRQAKPLSGSFIGDRADYRSMTVQVNVTAEAGHRAPAAVAAAGRRLREATATQIENSRTVTGQVMDR
ncbi:transglutaminase family protein [Devosia sp. ZB163]|uniref:transglutaminase family protein n=1 Tax=Devosia sp. ZB163 TaxID=3025938 RepID=UPI0023622471|nr:transglutaminase family protein [Devosia sp. ZB163]MDC9824345.1 transglutaminase family protein [Devosia sp. ZB163]